MIDNGNHRINALSARELDPTLRIHTNTIMTVTVKIAVLRPSPRTPMVGSIALNGYNVDGDENY